MILKKLPFSLILMCLCFEPFFSSSLCALDPDPSLEASQCRDALNNLVLLNHDEKLGELVGFDTQGHLQAFEDTAKLSGLSGPEIEFFKASILLSEIFNKGIVHRTVSDVLNAKGITSRKAIRDFLVNFSLFPPDQQMEFVNEVVDELTYRIDDSPNLDKLGVMNRKAKSFGMTLGEYIRLVHAWHEYKSSDYREVAGAVFINLVKRAVPAPSIRRSNSEDFVNRVVRYNSFFFRALYRVTRRSWTFPEVPQFNELKEIEIIIKSDNGVSDSTLEKFLLGLPPAGQRRFLSKNLKKLSPQQLQMLVNGAKRFEFAADVLEMLTNRNNQVAELKPDINQLKALHDKYNELNRALRGLDFYEGINAEPLSTIENANIERSLTETNRFLHASDIYDVYSNIFETYGTRMNTSEFLFAAKFMIGRASAFVNHYENIKVLNKVILLLQKNSATIPLTDPHRLDLFYSIRSVIDRFRDVDQIGEANRILQEKWGLVFSLSRAEEIRLTKQKSGVADKYHALRRSIKTALGLAE